MYLSVVALPDRLKLVSDTFRENCPGLPDGLAAQGRTMLLTQEIQPSDATASVIVAQ